MVHKSNLRVLHHFVILSFAVSTVGLVGCDGERSPNEEERTPPPITDASHRAFGSPQDKSLSPGDFDIENVGEEMKELDKAAATASNWKEADQDVRDLLESPSSAPQHIREQSAAHAMFRYYLNTDEWRENVTEEKLEVLAFYTDLLVKNRSPESDLVYAGLTKLEEHWSQQRIADAAEKTLRAAKQEYGSIEKSTRSESTSPEEADPTSGLADSRERHAEQVVEINRKLRAMVNGSG